VFLLVDPGREVERGVGGRRGRGLALQRLGQLGRGEVSQHVGAAARVLVLPHQNVAGLDVAVDDAARMHVVQRLGHLAQEVEHVFAVPVARAGELLLVGAQVAVQPLHHGEQEGAGQLGLLVLHAPAQVVAHLQPTQLLLHGGPSVDLDDFAGDLPCVVLGGLRAFEHGALPAFADSASHCNRCAAAGALVLLVQKHLHLLGLCRAGLRGVLADDLFEHFAGVDHAATDPEAQMQSVFRPDALLRECVVVSEDLAALGQIKVFVRGAGLLPDDLPESENGRVRTGCNLKRGVRGQDEHL